MPSGKSCTHIQTIHKITNKLYKTILVHFISLSLNEHLTCHGISSLVRQGVDGLEQVSSSVVSGERELCAGICAVLNHSYTGLVLANVEGPCQGSNETADVLKVFSAYAPWAIHQKNQICYCTDRALWRQILILEKNNSQSGIEALRIT